MFYLFQRGPVISFVHQSSLRGSQAEDGPKEGGLRNLKAKARASLTSSPLSGVSPLTLAGEEGLAVQARPEIPTERLPSPRVCTGLFSPDRWAADVSSGLQERPREEARLIPLHE